MSQTHFQYHIQSLDLSEHGERLRFGSGVGRSCYAIHLCGGGGGGSGERRRRFIHSGRGVKVYNSTRYAMRYASNKGSLSSGQRMGDDSCNDEDEHRAIYNE